MILVCLKKLEAEMIVLERLSLGMFVSVYFSEKADESLLMCDFFCTFANETIGR